MSMSRRKFFATATAASASLAVPSASAYGLGNPLGAKAKGSIESAGGPFALPSSIGVASGAPLGGIGTGFVELRPDGCFHEWQILNSGPWAGNRRRGATDA